MGDNRRFPFSFTSLQQEEPGQAQAQIITDITSRTSDIERRFRFNKCIFMITVTVSIIKIIWALYVILFTTGTCSVPLELWLKFMLLYDCTKLYCNTKTMKLHHQINNFAQEYAQSRQDDLEAGPGQRHVRRFANEVVETKARIERLNNWASKLYLILFIFATLQLKRDTCRDSAPALYEVTDYFIALQWLGLVILPCTLIGMACLCLPILLRIAARMPGRNPQVPASRTQIRQLPRILYHENLEGDHECGICYVEYQPNEELIQLPCNPKHHFHSQCITSWLEINGICPICRARVAE